MQLVKEALLFSFNRTKDRFLPYLGVSSLCIIVVLLAVSLFAPVFVLPIHFLPLFTEYHVPYLIGSFVYLVAIGTLVFRISIVAFLAPLIMLISEKRPSIMQSLSIANNYTPQVLPLIVPQIIFLYGIIVSSVFTLGISAIIWLYWSSFSIFVLLFYRRSGLDNLWASKQMLASGGIKVFFAYVLIFPLISIFFSIIGFVIVSLSSVSEQLSTVLMATVYPFLTLAAQPFIISYHLSLFGHLTAPAQPQRSMVGLILSGIGWVMIIIQLIALPMFAYGIMTTLQQEWDPRGGGGLHSPTEIIVPSEYPEPSEDMIDTDR